MAGPRRTRVRNDIERIATNRDRCQKAGPVRNLRNARRSEMRPGGVNHRTEAARSGPRTSPSRTRTYNLAVNRRDSESAEKPGSPLFSASYRHQLYSQTSASCRVFSRLEAVVVAQNGNQGGSSSHRQVILDPFTDLVAHLRDGSEPLISTIRSPSITARWIMVTCRRRCLAVCFQQSRCIEWADGWSRPGAGSVAFCEPQVSCRP